MRRLTMVINRFTQTSMRIFPLDSAISFVCQSHGWDIIDNKYICEDIEALE